MTYGVDILGTIEMVQAEEDVKKVYPAPPCIGLSGRFKLTVRDSKLNVVQETDWMRNLITDAGLNLMGTTNYLTACHVGTGNTAPAVSDTVLDTFLASTATIQSNTTTAQSMSPYYGSRTRTYRFAQGVATGNIAELGISHVTASSGPLYSRALVVDGMGNPTTITVQANEFLDVTYELRVLATESDTNYNATIDGINTTITVRVANATNNPAWGEGLGDPVTANTQINRNNLYETQTLGAVTTIPGGLAGGTTVNNLAYVDTSLEKTYTIVASLSESNFGTGIGALLTTTSLGAFQHSFNPKIDKTNTDTLTLNMSIAWTRAP